MVALVVCGSDLPLRGVTFLLGGLVNPPRSLQRRAIGAVSRFGPMSAVTVRVTTLVFVPVQFDRDIELVHYIELAVTVVNRQQPLARYSSSEVSSLVISQVTSLLA